MLAATGDKMTKDQVRVLEDYPLEELIRAVSVPDNDLLAHFGLTYDEWQDMREAQGFMKWVRKKG